MYLARGDSVATAKLKHLMVFNVMYIFFFFSFFSVKLHFIALKLSGEFTGTYIVNGDGEWRLNCSVFAYKSAYALFVHTICSCMPEIPLT